MDCKGWKKGRGLLVASDWLKRLACCCCCDVSQGFFLEVEEGSKIFALSSITHPRVKMYWQKFFFEWSSRETDKFLRYAGLEIFELKLTFGSSRETGCFWEMQAKKFFSWNSLLWSSWDELSETSKLEVATLFISYLEEKQIGIIQS